MLTLNGFPEAGKTFFAPAGRAAPELLQEQIASLCDSPISTFLLNSLHSYVAVLNDHRQILAASPDLLGALGPRWDGDCTGARWGEAFDCIHVEEGPDGCGTSRSCRQCGAVLAYLAAQSHSGPVEGECHLAMRREGQWQAMEFHVTASRLLVGPHRFTTMVFQDISPEKRRETLERLFFHDVGNMLHGLRGWSESLRDGWILPEEAARQVLMVSDRLSHEIHSHHRLMLAERGLLKAHPAPVDSHQLLHELVACVSQHPSAMGRALDLDLPEGAGRFMSDPDLLMRVLYNMAINAFEATDPGDSVRACFRWQGDRPCFSVHNAGEIPEHVRAQVFHRTFSTKASQGRGLGTHSMKLFGENLLKGTVAFDSSPEDGTTFRILLPPDLQGEG